jgi:CRP/FNR family transcriptional regulator
MTNQLILITEGYARIYAEYDNKYRIIDILKKGRIIDLLSVIGNNTYNLSATAINNVKVLLIEKQRLINILNNNKDFRNYIFLSISVISSRYINFLAFQNNKNVTGRIAEALLYLSTKVYESKVFPQTFTRKEMAELANTTTETIIRIFSELRKDKIIEIENKIITIKKIDFLSKLAEIG